MRRRNRAAITVCAACAVAPSMARADGTVPGEQIAQARVLGNEGIRLAESGDCAAAIPKLEGAEQLFHAPTTLEQLGQCLVKTGRVVAGTEALLRASHEPLGATAPPQFLAAQERARAAVAAAQARIAQLTVHVGGAPASGATITIDGAPFVAALLDTERPTDPGAHEVRATAAGYEPATAKVTLNDGEHKRVDLALVASTAQPAAAAAPTPASPAPATEPSPASIAPADGDRGPDRTPAYIAYGVGGVGLVVGVVFGVMALGTKSTLESACTPKTSCPASSQSDIDALGTKAWVANGGFAVAILGAGLGTYFLLTAHDGSDGSGPAKSASSGVRVAPYIAGTSAGLAASF